MDPNNLNNHLFESMFQKYHGMSLQQATEGYANRSNDIAKYLDKDLVSPEEQDEVWDNWKRTNQVGGAIQPPEGPVREVTKQFFSEPVDLGAAATGWMTNPTTMLVGGTQHVARSAIALSNAIKGGQTPTGRIYRGAVTSPQEQIAKEPDLPISFTEDHNVATSFASRNRRGTRGRIFKVDPTTEKGIYIPDLVRVQSGVGQGKNTRPEREWLIDPTSIPPT